MRVGPVFARGQLGEPMSYRDDINSGKIQLTEDQCVMCKRLVTAGAWNYSTNKWGKPYCFSCGKAKEYVDAGIKRTTSMPDGTPARPSDSGGTRSGDENKEVIDTEDKGIPTLNDTIVSSANPANDPAQQI